ncbi:MAG: AAA family ATPase [Candidatus Scalindua sp.]
MPKRIEPVTLECFKGATCTTTIDFDTNKPVVMIFGENGTGKSTITDAIDFVCNEEFGSINDRSVSSSKADLVASLGKAANDLKITLKYGGNQVGCHFNIFGMEISDADVRQYGEITIKLANTLICDKCGELPCRNKSGSYWECKCGSAYMHPFTIPN